MSFPSQEASIASNLRDDILRGHYRCGERLPSERDLAQRFGVHRSTVREAFKRLAQLGVATIHPGGARVAPIEEASLDVVEHLLALDGSPDPEILDQALEAMSGFRAMAARLGTERATIEQRAHMLEILETMMRTAERGDNADAKLISELGNCLVEASGNIILKLMRNGLQPHGDLEAEAKFMRGAEPNNAEVEPLLWRLSHAIENVDGATASEAVYLLSCLFRRSVREQTSERQTEPRLDSEPGARSAQGEVQS
ncbi:MAG: GntR family transcriptional regulator [Myxococcales bacterium]|nr:FadR family transcriptional regulator [Myxococcales bacterium]HIK85547.1 FadR family transcriptional regulator [Myxococcales bacterium]